MAVVVDIDTTIIVSPYTGKFLKKSSVSICVLISGWFLFDGGKKFYYNDKTNLLSGLDSSAFISGICLFIPRKILKKNKDSFSF